MQADIRLPIGFLFTIIGVLIAVFGLATAGSEIYRHSLGININVWTGIGLTIFGVLMLAMALRAGNKDRKTVEGKWSVGPVEGRADITPG